MLPDPAGRSGRPAQGLPAVHQMIGSHATCRNDLEGSANMLGGVVETGLAGDLGVVQAACIEPTLVPVGHPPKKLTVPPLRTNSTATSQASGWPIASIMTSTPRPAIQASDFINQLRAVANHLNALVGPQPKCHINLLSAPRNGNHTGAKCGLG